MFVPSTTGSRMAAVAWLAAALLLASPALAQGPDRGKTRKAVRSTPAASQPAPLRDGQAETRLLQVFRLASDGHAHLVVQRHLGSDSLAAWLVQRGFVVERLASRQGYRVLEVRR